MGENGSDACVSVLARGSHAKGGKDIDGKRVWAETTHSEVFALGNSPVGCGFYWGLDPTSTKGSSDFGRSIMRLWDYLLTNE